MLFSRRPFKPRIFRIETGSAWVPVKSAGTSRCRTTVGGSCKPGYKNFERFRFSWADLAVSREPSSLSVPSTNVAFVRSSVSHNNLFLAYNLFLFPYFPSLFPFAFPLPYFPLPYFPYNSPRSFTCRYFPE